MGPGSRENAAEILLRAHRLDETLRSSLARTTRTTNPRPRPGRNSLGQITGTLQLESLPSASFIATLRANPSTWKALREGSTLHYGMKSTTELMTASIQNEFTPRLGLNITAKDREKI